MPEPTGPCRACRASESDCLDNILYGGDGSPEQCCADCEHPLAGPPITTPEQIEAAIAAREEQAHTVTAWNAHVFDGAVLAACARDRDLLHIAVEGLAEHEKHHVERGYAHAWDPRVCLTCRRYQRILDGLAAAYTPEPTS